MPACNPLPPEILLVVFETVAYFDPNYIDVEILRCAWERNATLAACALVCTAWARLAQMVLYRDVSLGVTANPAADIENLERQPEAPPRRAGHTVSALARLLSTLESFKTTGNDLRHQIRFLHIPDVISYLRLVEQSYDSAATTGRGSANVNSADGVIRAISLCPGLLHLSLTIGILPESRPDYRLYTTVFGEKISRLKAVSPHSLRQLSLNLIPPGRFQFNGYSYTQTCCFTAYEIVLSIGSSITTLDVDITDHNEHLPFVVDNSQPIGDIVPALPALQTLICKRCTVDIGTAVFRNAPSLRKAVLPLAYGDATLRNFIPDSIEELVLQGLSLYDNISRFKRLKKLTLFSPPRLQDTTEELPVVLWTLPQSLEQLILPAIPVSSSDIADLLDATMRTLPYLHSLTFVRGPQADNSVNIRQNFSVPVKFVDGFSL